MSDAAPCPPDQREREHIVTDLDSNLLVEAGAGSGKTRSLVRRMVALIRTGTCTVDRIVAVTFTRKAAAELRQRFQVRLETALDNEESAEPSQWLEDAIRDLDHAFLGTIHAFCARLLRERPFEAGLDPGFREVRETEALRMKRALWLDFLERLGADNDPDLKELERLGIEPDALHSLFDELVENPDVDFSAPSVPPPDEEEIRGVRAGFDELLDRADGMMAGRPSTTDWQTFGKQVRTLLYRRRALDWNDRSVFFDALAEVHPKPGKLTQRNWSDTAAGRKEAKHLRGEFEDFTAKGSPADELLRSWWAHRYAVAMGVAVRAADEFAQQRKQRGELNFQDLLVLTAELLRDSPSARRDLGERYRRVLVDEFQDTDPLQAEILLLLTSEPEDGNDWRKVVPRPGALFAVGDPKQSIYRFRRADISLYAFVRRRFKAFGEVLQLDANFRSLKAIEELVNGVFKDRFAQDDTDHQAAFAPLLVQPWVRDEGDPGPGLVATYSVLRSRNHGDNAMDDAERIASAIARRVKAGERRPGDFLVLTRVRKYLGVYARALAKRNLPVAVSGAGLGFQEELDALLLLLRCLADPAHEVHVLGVLTGPLFGVTLDRLVEHRDAAGSFRVTQPADGVGEVARALNVLHGWWSRARREPADLTAERLVAETGLFSLAAAGTLGDLRAGALVYLLDAVRARALEGNTSLAGAVDALETALEWEDAEAPLVPEHRNCVRVMNLHRAKGLEAKVVFLAAPFPPPERAPDKRVTRDEGDIARGTMPIVVKRGWSRSVVAQPLSWEKDQEIETSFQKAEEVRLLYVAATRARDELWVARGAKKAVWAAMEKWVRNEAARASAAEDESIAKKEALMREDPPAPDELPPETDLAGAVAASVEATTKSGERTYRLATVTDRVKRKTPAAEPVDMPRARPESATHSETLTSAAPDPQTRGADWGSVVHEVLAAAGDGVKGDALARRAHDLLVQHERTLDSTGTPTELDALLVTVESVRRSKIWRRAMAAEERHMEAPFAVNVGSGPGRSDVIEGVIDLVFREGDQWVVADYKTDRDAPGFTARAAKYRAQVNLYADCWERLTGERVAERVLVFTAQERTESW